MVQNGLKSMCFARGCLKKVRKTSSENAGEVFARRFFDFFWDASRETPTFETILDGRGPKLVSKVSDSYDAVQQRSTKHHARAPSRAQSDDPLSKNSDFATRQRIPRIHQIPWKRWQLLRRRPTLTHVPGARMTVVKQTPSNEPKVSRCRPPLQFRCGAAQ